MAQRRTQKPKSEGISYGMGGIAKLYKVDSTKLRIEFIETGKEVNLNVVQGDIWKEGSNANLPEYVPFKSMKSIADGGRPLDCRLVMEEKNEKVLFANPLSGTYKAKFVGFAANPPAGFVPSWTEEKNKWDKIQRRTNPFIKLIDPKQRWAGAVVRTRLIDKFGKDPDDGNTTIWQEEKGTNWKLLEDFCACVGFEYWNEPFTENHLPRLMQVALENDYEFEVVFSNGYVTTWLPSISDDSMFVDDVDETFPPAEKSEADKLLEE